ncbi:unnamed protein product [Rotaria magnacalcarata]|uniref:Peptidase C19 ubiquitin carboxyl-terminal hydrolase domain-containing protein n=3 Tax=Rotaria magnacalcarata TaxID=392030 RepID=A0A815GJV3_9BILA|nr:unnamed protein product [Rotaria magnacalcarata]
MNWNSSRNRMIDLRNQDNKTCYINAALECLGSTLPLTEWLFEQVDNLNTCRLSNERKFCSICELTKIILLIHPSPRNKSTELSCGTIPSADSTRTHVHLISRIFNVGEQEDVCEFMITLLDHFNCCLSSHLSISSTLPMKPTIIDQIFNIKLLSSGKRQAFDDTRCRHVSSNEVLNHPEAFMLFYAKLTNTILNNEPILGQTESSITIGNQCSIDRIEKNRRNFYHVSNKVLHPSISSKELAFILNEPSDDSIAEVSDGEETRIETCKKLASVAAGIRIEQVFEETLSQKHHFRLNETELLKMNQYRQEEF